MLVSADFLTVLVSVALGLSSLTPLVLIVFFIRDWIKGKIW